MLLGVIVAVLTAVIGVVIYVLHMSRRAERQRYYTAAQKVLKEECLNNAISSQSRRISGGQKLMLYLTWKDSEKQGYVFDPEKPIRIGRSPENNEICIREETVSSRHCVLFLYQGELYVRDLNSRNGTWIRRGMRRRPVEGTEPVNPGDRVIVGDLAIRVLLFTFDMAYM